MLGRSCARLLVFSLILSAPIVKGQSDDPHPGRDAISREFANADSPGERLPASEKPLAVPPIHSPFLPQPSPVSRGNFGLRQLTQAAGIIFSGRVTGIQRNPSSFQQAVETVSITFHVENAIRGTAPGDRLILTQWMGLWSGGQQYRVGERVLLFLYPRSKIGLTSTVGGPFGRFQINSAGRVLFSNQQLSAFQQASVPGGRSSVRLSDFAWAVKQASQEE